MVPVRGEVPAFGATSNATGLSPARGMLPDTVIHGTLDVALQMQRSWVAPPQVDRVALLDDVEGSGAAFGAERDLSSAHRVAASRLIDPDVLTRRRCRPSHQDAGRTWRVVVVGNRELDDAGSDARRSAPDIAARTRRASRSRCIQRLS